MAEAAGRGGGSGALLQVSPPSTAARMSRLLTRPPAPVPGTCERSILFSRAMRRTSGELRTFDPAASGGSALGLCSMRGRRLALRRWRGRRRAVGWRRRQGGAALALRAWASAFARQRRGDGCRSAVGVDQGHDGLNRHRLAFGDFDFLQHAGGGRGNLRVHFVGGDFKQRLVALDFVAGLLQPLGDGAFKNAFAHLGHDDVDSHGYLLGFENLDGARDIPRATRLECLRARKSRRRRERR